ncbi:molybdate ABC transporter substrate-binding protein [Pseudoalteromonas sp.]|uniref:molybdate ABC transporter substrate-binding protein n=1 Tax=Alteromonadales TaxID=135622 RepID=UPI002618A6D1|nr:molybdate ABC transporter substrate-binding protein [Pseudoalteromonas sp.]MCP4586424.1 molybdate ABC transporter substrate-binding protein [Pseudoalteromonas sp.]
MLWLTNKLTAYTIAILLVFLCCFFPASAHDKDTTSSLMIACSANFVAVMDKLLPVFKAQVKTDIQVKVVTGSSGTLATQLRYGAPYDVFFSADAILPTQLKNDGFGIESTMYALGDLVFYSSEGNDSLNDIMTRLPQLTLAIANPRYAPYGQAAVEVLAHLQTKPKKTVTGGSILHAFQYVESQNAELGLIAKSLLQQPHKGTVIAIPHDWYQPIEQHVLLVTHSEFARQFYHFVQTEQAQQLIKSMGYR